MFDKSYMSYGEAKFRIIKALPNDFLKDNRNRQALNMMEKLFEEKDKVYINKLMKGKNK